MNDIPVFSDAFGGVPIRAHREADETDSFALAVQSRIRVRGELWSFDNPMPGAVDASVHQPRNTSNKDITMPHGSLGIYDQTIQIHHDLSAGGTGVDLRVRIITLMTTVGGNPFGPVIYDRTIPADYRLTIAPEVGASVVSTSNRSIDELVELRMPYWQFLLRLNAVSSPDAGDVSIFTCWRQ